MVLVTGGAGLLGSEVIKQLLAEGREVKAIYNKTKIDFSHPRLSIVHCDILDVIGLEEVIAGTDELYHCAALVAFTSKDVSKLFKINVEGTANIVNAALNAGVRKMVYASSVAALGQHSGTSQLLNEEVQWVSAKGTTRYAQSKYLAELEVWRGIAEGLNAVIVNPSLILGPGNWNDGSTGIFKTIYKEFPWYSEGGTGFVDVRDVAKAMIALMRSGITAERFIVSAENGNFKNVFARIAAAFNKKPATKKVSPLLAAIIWRLEALKSRFTGTTPIVTKETAASALNIQQFDNNKLKAFLPSFKYYPLQQTIEYTCAALQQKLNMQ